MTTAEVLLSTFVVALVMMTLFNLFPTSALAVKRGENQLVAQDLSQSALEEARATPFADLALGTTDLGPFSERGTTFSRSREVYQVSEDSDLRYLKGVRITVTWVEQGRERSRTQETWICNVDR